MFKRLLIILSLSVTTVISWVYFNTSTVGMVFETLAVILTVSLYYLLKEVLTDFMEVLLALLSIDLGLIMIVILLYWVL